MKAVTRHSLNRTAGNAFLNLVTGLHVVANRRARLTRTLGRYPLDQTP
jgi:hypothetical protein